MKRITVQVILNVTDDFEDRLAPIIVEDCLNFTDVSVGSDLSEMSEIRGWNVKRIGETEQR